nr:S24 family peptidase [Martelella limonii]
MREIRVEQGDPSREEFAPTLGLHVNSLANYERGDRAPNIDVLLAYRENLHVDLHWLLTGEGEMFGDALKLQSGANLTSEAGKRLLALPYFDAEASAGVGRIALDELPSGSIAFERAFLRNLGASPDNCFIIKSYGDSMLPTIPDNSLLIVDESQTEKIEHGCIYVFRVGEIMLVKRAKWHMTGKLELSSDNDTYQSEFLDQTHADTLSVLGRVVYFCRVP